VTVTATVVCLALAQMHPGAGQPHRPARPGLHQMVQFMGILKHLSEMSFDSERVGVAAVGALKDDIRRKPAEVIKDLEAQLGKVKTQGLRNAIRFSLKDVYKQQGEDEKCLAQIRMLIAENDKALQAAK